MCSQRTVERLKKENGQLQQELAHLKQPRPHKHRHIQTDEEYVSRISSKCRCYNIQSLFSINALHQAVEQKTAQLKDLNEKYVTFTSEISSNEELRAELLREK